MAVAHLDMRLLAFPAADVVGKLVRYRPRRGSSPSPVALREAIDRFVEQHNRDPRPFVWTADPGVIVAKVQRGFHALAWRQAC